MKLSIINEGGYNLGLLYHATEAKSVAKILKTGLDPSLSRFADSETDEPPPHHFVYLSDVPNVAMMFAPGGRHNPTKGKPALLAVRLPKKLQGKLVLDRGEFIRAPFLIPPQYISVVK